MWDWLIWATGRWLRRVRQRRQAHHHAAVVESPGRTVDPPSSQHHELSNTNLSQKCTSQAHHKRLEMCEVCSSTRGESPSRREGNTYEEVAPNRPPTNLSSSTSRGVVRVVFTFSIMQLWYLGSCHTLSTLIWE